MRKHIRATYIIARFINNRPDGESVEMFSHRIGLPYTLDANRLNKRKDVGMGLMYRVAKAFGYQIIIYNPNPPNGLEKMYVVGADKSPIVPREQKGIHHVRYDAYTGEVSRIPRKYKRRKTFKKVG